MAFITKKVRIYICERCGKEWQPRSLPKVCPQCKTKYWDKPKLRKWEKKNPS